MFSKKQRYYIIIGKVLFLCWGLYLFANFFMKNIEKVQSFLEKLINKNAKEKSFNFNKLLNKKK